RQVSTNDPPDLTSWFIFSSFCCSSRSSTHSRTLPPCSPPPDKARCLAPAQTARRHTHPSHHPATVVDAPATMEHSTGCPLRANERNKLWCPLPHPGRACARPSAGLWGGVRGEAREATR